MRAGGVQEARQYHYALHTAATSQSVGSRCTSHPRVCAFAREHARDVHKQHHAAHHRPPR